MQSKMIHLFIIKKKKIKNNKKSLLPNPQINHKNSTYKVYSIPIINKIHQICNILLKFKIKL